MNNIQKWKLIHKETGLTFKQYRKKNDILDHTGLIRNADNMFPVILESGRLAVYVDREYYPCLFFLNNNDWSVRTK